ncbi:MAG: response regulator transcription factor [Chloroflexi bacterium]|nr:response regulator transcription factor [Chloroflexota bacterium]
MSENKTVVVIFSQQSLFREGIEHSLHSVDNMEISGFSVVDEGVMSKIDSLAPDVAIIDLDVPSDSGFTLAQRIKQLLPSIGIVALTSNPSDEQLFQALKGQASAYNSKEITANELAVVIKRVAAGEHPINEGLLNRPSVADQVLQQFQELSRRNGGTDRFISPLTTRETEILSYIARGLLNKQIAATLGISEQTIKNHVTSILRKLNANARTEAVVVAIKQGLITIQ